jgi:hypothetical protein
VKDRRRFPFCLQEHRAVELIHANWSGRERTTALAIYQAMTYLASVHYRDGGRDGFAATRAEIAEKAGSKPATVDVYSRAFVAIGILVIERRQTEKGRDLASVWVLESAEVGVTEEEPSRLRGVPEGAPTGGSRRAPEEEPPTRARPESEVEGRQDTPPAPRGGEAKRVWTKAMERLDRELSDYVAGAFVRPLEAVAIRDGALVLRAPHSPQLIRDRYLGPISDAVKEAGDLAVVIEMSDREQHEAHLERRRKRRRSA